MIGISELLAILPQIIIYLIVGFVFLKVFHFVALKKNEDEVEHVLTSALVVGFIICKLADLISTPIYNAIKNFILINDSVYNAIKNVILVGFSIVMGYVLGKYVTSPKWRKVLEALRIYDSGNVYYWDDLMPYKKPMMVRVCYEDRSYKGMVYTFESYSNSPHIVLCSFIVYDMDGKVKEDHSNDNQSVIVLDTSNAIHTYVIYESNGIESESIKTFIDYHQSLCDNKHSSKARKKKK